MHATSRWYIAIAVIAGGIVGVIFGVSTAYVAQYSSLVALVAYPGLGLLELTGRVPRTGVGTAWPRPVPLMWANAGAWLFFGAVAGALYAARRLQARQQ